jgi:hypothetical protein
MTKQSKAHEALAAKITEDYVWARRFREQFTPDWDRYYRLYRSKVITEGTGQSYAYESKIVVPYVFSVIETQLPLIMQQIFGSGKFVEALGQNIDSEIHASEVSEIMDYQFDRNINAVDLVYLLSKQALIYGTSPCFGDWQKQIRTVKARVPLQTLNGQAIGEKTIEVDKIIKNNPRAQAIDIFKYFQCPATPGNPWEDDSVLFAGWEFLLTYQEMLEFRKAGVYNDNVLQLRGMSGASDLFEAERNRLSILGKTAPDDINAASVPRDFFPCILYFGLLPSNKGYTYKQITCCYPDGYPEGEGKGGNGLILQVEDNPYHHEKIPINLTRVNRNEGELYGISDIEVIESLQIELTDQRNQRNDILVRSLNPMWKAKAGETIDEAQLVFRPHGIIELDDVNNLQELRPNLENIRLAFQEEEIIKRDIQFASGISDFIVGQFQNSSGFNDTATGISLIQGAAQNRIVLKTMFIQRTVKNIAEMIWALDQQFLPFDTVFRVLDPLSASNFKFIRATPQIINGKYDFKIVSAPSAGNPQVRRNQLVQISQFITQMMPLVNPEGGQPQLEVNWTNLIKKILDEFEISNIAEILPALNQKQLVNIDIDASLEDEGSVSIDPETENQMMLEGRKDIPTSTGDDDITHLIAHKNAEELMSAEILTENKAHQTRHVEQLRQKQDRTVKLREDINQQAVTQAGGIDASSTLTSAIQSTNREASGEAGEIEATLREVANRGA